MENIPENSIAAYKNAMRVGVDVIELDVWLTADKEVVVFHDGTFDRCCGKEGHVNQTAFKDLPPLIATDKDMEKNVQDKGIADDAYRIPKFEEVLQVRTTRRTLTRRPHTLPTHTPPTHTAKGLADKSAANCSPRTHALSKSHSAAPRAPFVHTCV